MENAATISKIYSGCKVSVVKNVYILLTFFSIFIMNVIQLIYNNVMFYDLMIILLLYLFELCM